MQLVKRISLLEGEKEDLVTQLDLMTKTKQNLEKLIQTERKEKEKIKESQGVASTVDQAELDTLRDKVSDLEAKLHAQTNANKRASQVSEEQILSTVIDRKQQRSESDVDEEDLQDMLKIIMSQVKKTVDGTATLESTEELIQFQLQGLKSSKAIENSFFD